MAFDFGHLLTLPEARAAYSDRTAYVMAECAALAYKRFEDSQQLRQELQSELAKCRLSLAATFNEKDTQGYLAVGPTLAVLAFRGTEQNWKDILTDLKFRFRRDKQGNRIHRGFNKAYDRVAQQVQAEINKLGVPFYLTGHSLGGALASIATMRLQPQDRIAACYTFGSPRVGGKEFVRTLFKVPVYRTVHAADIVARVPLFLFGYRHAGDLRYIAPLGEVFRNPSGIRPWLRFLGSAILKWRSLFTDHKSAHYVRRLAQWAVTRNA